MSGSGYAAAPRSMVRVSTAGHAPLVVVGGLVTTALALTGVWLASQYDQNVMGWYANYVLPVGAILVGLVASSGYGAASYVSGTKVTGWLLALVLVLLALSYFTAKWVEFRLVFPDGVLDDGTPAAFWSYFDASTRSIYWVARNAHDTDGAPLGAWGYALRGLELAGFVGGGAFIPFALRRLPYCAGCQAYKKTKRIAFFPAGVAVKSISKKKVEALAAYEAADAAAAAQGEATLAAILAAGASTLPAALHSEVAKVPKLGNYAAQKLSARLAVDLVYCRRCADGELKAIRLTGRGKQISRTELAQQSLGRETVTAFWRAKG